MDLIIHINAFPCTSCFDFYRRIDNAFIIQRKQKICKLIHMGSQVSLLTPSLTSKTACTELTKMECKISIHLKFLNPELLHGILQVPSSMVENDLKIFPMIRNYSEIATELSINTNSLQYLVLDLYPDFINETVTILACWLSVLWQKLHFQLVDLAVETLFVLLQPFYNLVLFIQSLTDNSKWTDYSSGKWDS